MIVFVSAVSLFQLSETHITRYPTNIITIIFECFLILLMLFMTFEIGFNIIHVKKKTEINFLMFSENENGDFIEEFHAKKNLRLIFKSQEAKI